MSFFFLLGLSWILAVFVAAGAPIAFSYIFSILVSSQGIFIFYYHCWRQKQIKQEILSFFTCSKGELPMLQHSNSKVKARTFQPKMPHTFGKVVANTGAGVSTTLKSDDNSSSGNDHTTVTTISTSAPAPAAHASAAPTSAPASSTSASTSASASSAGATKSNAAYAALATEEAAAAAAAEATEIAAAGARRTEVSQIIGDDAPSTSYIDVQGSSVAWPSECVEDMDRNRFKRGLSKTDTLSMERPRLNSDAVVLERPRLESDAFALARPHHPTTGQQLQERPRLLSDALERPQLGLDACGGEWDSSMRVRTRKLRTHAASTAAAAPPAIVGGEDNLMPQGRDGERQSVSVAVAVDATSFSSSSAAATSAATSAAAVAAASAATASDGNAGAVQDPALSPQYPTMSRHPATLKRREASKLFTDDSCEDLSDRIAQSAEAAKPEIVIDTTVEANSQLVGESNH